MIRRSSLIALLLIATNTWAQTPAKEFDAEKYDPAYALAIPQGWGVERMGIPIEFAPSIPYKGVEDLRFNPGWSDPKSNGYWTYAFLWHLEGRPESSPQTIEKNLTAYYNGLVGRNIERRKIPKEKLVQIKAKIKQITTDKGDLQTYSGTIDMLDYMAQMPITLNCIVHIKLCPQEQNNTFMFYELSPRPPADDIWKELQNLWTTFECSKAK
ncbi:hypothetical protein SAMN04488109_0269 [Chryseolinea serpens]|uniref:Uncharacterized protein n=1 Tax=Chryseolinea serpens TaxID=947013 RepID=A0A1M5JTS2_9BACT|nr:hypothetical protein [Chryseolinea serpens]SHG43670.1 hypothetical protein SAMN04488109_0269 [Chryseolinea serpens]